MNSIGIANVIFIISFEIALRIILKYPLGCFFIFCRVLLLNLLENAKY